MKVGISDLPLTPAQAELCAPWHQVEDGKEHFLEKGFAVVGFDYPMVKSKAVDRYVNIEPQSTQTL